MGSGMKAKFKVRREKDLKLFTKNQREEKERI